MGVLIALLLIGSFSLLIVRVGATALMMTGLSWDSASFQAYSAFFGVGFTTSEAEMVVNHPVRRRIIRDLILMGNIGLTSALATLIVAFVQTSGFQGILGTIGWLAAGAALLFVLARIGFLKRALDRVIRYSLSRVGMVRAMDYELLLRVSTQGDWHAWLVFFLKGIASQASSALERVGLLRELHGHYREQLVRRNAPIRLERLLDHIFSNPLIGQPEIMEHLGVSRTTAFRYMDHLLSTGMLEPLHPQQNNHRWYVARELLNILE